MPLLPSEVTVQVEPLTSSGVGIRMSTVARYQAMMRRAAAAILSAFGHSGRSRTALNGVGVCGVVVIALPLHAGLADLDHVVVVSKVPRWLGVDPLTGKPYLPEATKSPAGIARGMGVYQVVGVLTDIDLFRRLRARGQARGTEGLPDRQAALRLVTGEPFTGQRRGGWVWLADGVRVDQHMVCAVVDVAHLVTISALQSGDLQAARSACEIAMVAAPYEDTPRLDLAAVVAAEGDRQAAERILRDDVCNRAETGEAPDDLPERTADLVAAPPWQRKGRVA